MTRDCRSRLFVYVSVLAPLLLGVMLPIGTAAEDLVEFVSGAKANGTVKDIRQDDKEFDFEVQLGGRALVRTYAFEKVHAVTMKGKRYVLTAKVSVSESGESGPLRTKTEVLELIDTVGRTAPDWFDSTPLEYPETLDLNWPLKPPEKGWNNQKNVGQYNWDIVNPNPNRWRSGIRLMHEIMSRHGRQPELLRRDMTTLAGMHFRLFQDYARAAFWLQQAKVQLPDPQAIQLGECYWRLGNRQMALDILKSPRYL